ncbi:freyrasin family ranthipeptide [Paenibacillus polymyxa]
MKDLLKQINAVSGPILAYGCPKNDWCFYCDAKDYCLHCDAFDACPLHDD